MGRIRKILSSVVRVMKCIASARHYRDTSDSDEDVVPGRKGIHEEEYVKGVHVAYKRRADGSKEIKLVKFSPNEFSDSQSREWWEENRVKVYDYFDKV